MKQRLVGAIVLVALGVIFIPMFLEGPDRNVVPELEPLPELMDTGPARPLESFPAADDVPAAPLTSVLSAPLPAETGSVSEMPDIETVEESVPQPQPPVEAPQASAAEPGPLGSWVVQVGSFSSQKNALALRDKLRTEGFATQVEKVTVEGKVHYRVRVGPYLERTEADQNQQQLAEKFKLSARVLSYP